jgi:hypothetical protein
MNKFLIIAAVAVSMVACNKADLILENQLRHNMPSNENNIPIATVDANGNVHLLFLQKDVQEAFQKEFPNLQLVFAEVKDNDNKAGLLYQIYDITNNVKETSFSVVFIFKDGVYYAPTTNFQYAGEGSYFGWTITCSTSDPECSKTVEACFPVSTYCTECPNKAVCGKSISSGSGSGSGSVMLKKLVNAVLYATRIYAAY